MLDLQLDAYLNHLKAERALSPNTVSAYARDLARFSGYRLVSLRAYDSLPQTPHVELVAKLTKVAQNLLV